MFLNLGDKSNWFGLAGVAFLLAFWLYVFHPRAGPEDYYLPMEVLLALLGLSSLMLVLAALLGSRWWLGLLVGPLLGGLFLLCLRS
jgi:hypothetical protein